MAFPQDRVMTPLKISHFDISTDSEFDLISGTVTPLAVIFSMLFERGMASGHIYQPPVNHRSLNTRIMTTKHEKGDALLDSLASREIKQSFAASNMINVFLYEVEQLDEKIDESNLEISQRTLLKVYGQGNGKQHDWCYLSNGIMKKLSGKGFRRLLAFFGILWTDENGVERGDDAEPTLTDVMSFYRMIG